MNAFSLFVALVASAQQAAPVYQTERVCSNADGSITYTREISMPTSGMPGAGVPAATLDTWKVNGKAVLDAGVSAVKFTHFDPTGERTLMAVTLARANGAELAPGVSALSDVLLCRVSRLPPPPPGAHPRGGR